MNLADSIGSRTHPDGETLEMIAFERSLGLIVTIIGLIIVFIRMYQKQKAQSFQHSECQPPTSVWQKFQDGEPGMTLKIGQWHTNDKLLLLH